MSKPWESPGFSRGGAVNVRPAFAARGDIVEDRLAAGILGGAVDLELGEDAIERRPHAVDVPWDQAQRQIGAAGLLAGSARRAPHRLLELAAVGAG